MQFQQNKKNKDKFNKEKAIENRGEENRRINPYGGFLLVCLISTIKFSSFASEYTFNILRMP